MEKLIKRKIKFARKGTALGVEIVAPVLLGRENWDKMTSELKSAYTKLYNSNTKLFDNDYVNKMNEAYNTSENQTNSVDDLYNQMSDYRKQIHYNLNSEDAIQDKINNIVKNDPIISLEDTRINNMTNVNKLDYLTKVKSTRNNKYYDSLIAKANAKYGTNFKTREDIAAFLDRFGAKNVDGIIGPETEALLDFYYPSNTTNSINTRRMYKNESNDKVRDRTLNTLAYGLETEPEETSFIDTKLFPNSFTFDRPITPYSFNFSSTYVNPMTKYYQNKYRTLFPQFYIESKNI